MYQIAKSIIIKAPVQHVWNTMLNHPTYEQWTSIFQEGSSYIGSWNQGEHIKFVDGSGQGMTSQIDTNRLYEYISIKHLGQIMHNDASELVTTSYDTPMYENYKFEYAHDATTLTITMTGVPQEYVAMFDKMRPDALELLKMICETTYNSTT